MLEHHNQHQSVHDFKGCKAVKVSKYPKKYQTQIVAGEKYIFENFEVSDEACGKVKLAKFEGVELPWAQSKAEEWYGFYAEQKN